MNQSDGFDYVKEPEGCDFCGGNCGQCGSPHVGGPPDMNRMIHNLHQKPVVKQKPPQTFFERVRRIFTKRTTRIFIGY